jgi:hypothetical protein
MARSPAEATWLSKKAAFSRFAAGPFRIRTGFPIPATNVLRPPTTDYTKPTNRRGP